MSNKATSVLVIGLLCSVSAWGAMQKVGESMVRFQGKGPAGFKLEGTSHDLRLKDDGKVLQIIVPLSGLETGIALRDKHMRERYLETDKYPDAVFEIPWSAVHLPHEGQTLDATATGKLTLHGKTKDVAVTYSVKRTGDVFQVTGRAPINLKDYDIQVPSYLGVTVHPDIVALVDFNSKKT